MKKVIFSFIWAAVLVYSFIFFVFHFFIWTSHDTYGISDDQEKMLEGMYFLKQGEPNRAQQRFSKALKAIPRQ